MNQTQPAPVTVYSGHTTNWAALALTIGCGCLLLTNSAMPWDLLALATGVLILLALIATVVTSTSLRVTIGSNGLSIRAGVFGWPRYHCSLEQIDRVEPIELSSLSWGSGIWWIPGGNIRFTLRRGPAIQVYVKGRRKLRKVTVNVEDTLAAIAAIERARAALNT